MHEHFIRSSYDSTSIHTLHSTGLRKDRKYTVKVPLFETGRFPSSESHDQPIERNGRLGFSEVEKTYLESIHLIKGSGGVLEISSGSNTQSL